MKRTLPYAIATITYTVAIAVLFHTVSTLRFNEGFEAGYKAGRTVNVVLAEPTPEPIVAETCMRWWFGNTNHEAARRSLCRNK